MRIEVIGKKPTGRQKEPRHPATQVGASSYIEEPVDLSKVEAAEGLPINVLVHHMLSQVAPGSAIVLPPTSNETTVEVRFVTPPKDIPSEELEKQEIEVNLSAETETDFNQLYIVTVCIKLSTGEEAVSCFVLKPGKEPYSVQLNQLTFHSTNEKVIFRWPSNLKDLPIYVMVTVSPLKLYSEPTPPNMPEMSTKKLPSRQFEAHEPPKLEVVRKKEQCSFNLDNLQINKSKLILMQPGQSSTVIFVLGQQLVDEAQALADMKTLLSSSNIALTLTKPETKNPHQDMIPYGFTQYPNKTNELMIKLMTSSLLIDNDRPSEISPKNIGTSIKVNCAALFIGKLRVFCDSEGEISIFHQSNYNGGKEEKLLCIDTRNALSKQQLAVIVYILSHFYKCGNNPPKVIFDNIKSYFGNGENLRTYIINPSTFNSNDTHGVITSRIIKLLSRDCPSSDEIDDELEFLKKNVIDTVNTKINALPSDRYSERAINVTTNTKNKTLEIKISFSYEGLKKSAVDKLFEISIAGKNLHEIYNEIIIVLNACLFEGYIKANYLYLSTISFDITSNAIRTLGNNENCISIDEKTISFLKYPDGRFNINVFLHFNENNNPTLIQMLLVLYHNHTVRLFEWFESHSEKFRIARNLKNPTLDSNLHLIEIEDCDFFEKYNIEPRSFQEFIFGLDSQSKCLAVRLFGGGGEISRTNLFIYMKDHESAILLESRLKELIESDKINTQKLNDDCYVVTCFDKTLLLVLHHIGGNNNKKIEDALIRYNRPKEHDLIPPKNNIPTNTPLRVFQLSGKFYKDFKKSIEDEVLWSKLKSHMLELFTGEEEAIYAIWGDLGIAFSSAIEEKLSEPDKLLDLRKWIKNDFFTSFIIDQLYSGNTEYDFYYSVVEIIKEHDSSYKELVKCVYADIIEEFNKYSQMQENENKNVKEEPKKDMEEQLKNFLFIDALTRNLPSHFNELQVKWKSTSNKSNNKALPLINHDLEFVNLTDFLNIPIPEHIKEHATSLFKGAMRDRWPKCIFKQLLIREMIEHNMAYYPEEFEKNISIILLELFLPKIYDSNFQINFEQLSNNNDRVLAFSFELNGNAGFSINQTIDSGNGRVVHKCTFKPTHFPETENNTYIVVFVLGKKDKSIGDVIVIYQVKMTFIDSLKQKLVITSSEEKPKTSEALQLFGVFTTPQENSSADQQSRPPSPNKK